MIFQHTIEAVLSGDKTQTRRLVKPGETLAGDGSEVRHGSGRLKWAVGRTYGVQPGRGQSAVARIRLTAIRREDVRGIWFEDVYDEGFDELHEFLEVWAAMHDPEACEYAREHGLFDTSKVGALNKYLAMRPAHCYEAWALTFERVAPWL